MVSPGAHKLGNAFTKAGHTGCTVSNTRQQCGTFILADVFGSFGIGKSLVLKLRPALCFHNKIEVVSTRLELRGRVALFHAFEVIFLQSVEAGKVYERPSLRQLTVSEIDIFPNEKCF